MCAKLGIEPTDFHVAGGRSRPQLMREAVRWRRRMARLSRQQSRERWAQLRALICEWDPIGVTDDPDWPRDEYDCLLGPLLRALERGASEAELAAFLGHEIENHFGLDPAHYDFPAVAAKLRNWYDESWRGSGL